MQCPRCQHENPPLGLGKLCRRTGKEAQAYLTTATTMYREMAMQFWLEQAAGETATLA